MSLLRLFESEVFTLPHLLFYLTKKNEEGIQHYLINKLYSYSPEEIEKVVLQLFNMLITRPECHFLENLLFTKSLESPRLAFKLYWYLGSSSDFCEEAQLTSLYHAFEYTFINGVIEAEEGTPIPSMLFGFTIEEREIERYMRKKLHADFLVFNHRFIDSLCKISVALTLDPVAERDNKLKAWLRTLESWILTTRAEYSQSTYSTQLFRGVFFPMSFSSANNQIVSILPEESLCFHTKVRVPIKVLLETISIQELERPHTNNRQENATSPEPLPDLSMRDIQNIKSAIEAENKFAGLEEFAESSEYPPDLQVLSSSPEESLDRKAIWGEHWEDTAHRIRTNSPFRHYSSWQLHGVIVKGLDDIRQEQLAMQFIRSFKRIFDEASLPLFLQPYDIIVVSSNMGIIEYLPNTQSIHSIKKRCSNFSSLYNFYIENWGSGFLEAQKNFTESMAAYSLVCYLLNVKDRHNGNILLDTKGRLIHIDFGFFFNSSPGGSIGFEKAPFKLTEELIGVMGGQDSEMFLYFKTLLYRGFLEVRKHNENLLLLLEMMKPSSHLPCLYDFSKVVRSFRQRFHQSKTDVKCMEVMNELVASSTDNFWTNKYDAFQFNANGIL